MDNIWSIIVNVLATFFVIGFLYVAMSIIIKYSNEDDTKIQNKDDTKIQKVKTTTPKKKTEIELIREATLLNSSGVLSIIWSSIVGSLITLIGLFGENVLIIFLGASIPFIGFINGLFQLSKAKSILNKED